MAKVLADHDDLPYAQMALPNGFQEHFASVLADTTAAAAETPLSLDFIRRCNVALLEPFYPDKAGLERSQHRELRWPYRQRDGSWGEIWTDATTLGEMHSELYNSFRRFESCRGGLERSEPEGVAGIVAWPAAITMRCQPFEVASNYVAFLVLFAAAERVGWRITRLNWNDQVARARLYWAVRRDEPATIKPFAEHLAPALERPS